MVQSFGEHSPISNLCKQSQVDHKSYCNNIPCAPRNWPSHRHHRLLVAVSYRPGNSVIFDIWKTSNAWGILAKKTMDNTGAQAINEWRRNSTSSRKQAKQNTGHSCRSDCQRRICSNAGDFRGSRHDQLDRHFLSTDFLRCNFPMILGSMQFGNDTLEVGEGIPTNGSVFQSLLLPPGFGL